MGMERKSKRKKGGGGREAASSRNELDVLAVQFSYSVRLERKREAVSRDKATDEPRESSLIFPFRFKDRSGILKGGSLKLIAYVHVSSKECAWICS